MGSGAVEGSGTDETSWEEQSSGSAFRLRVME